MRRARKGERSNIHGAVPIILDRLDLNLTSSHDMTSDADRALMAASLCTELRFDGELTRGPIVTAENWRTAG